MKGKREGYGEAAMPDGGWYKGDYFDNKVFISENILNITSIIHH